MFHSSQDCLIQTRECESVPFATSARHLFGCHLIKGKNGIRAKTCCQDEKGTKQTDGEERKKKTNEKRVVERTKVAAAPSDPHRGSGTQTAAVEGVYMEVNAKCTALTQNDMERKKVSLCMVEHERGPPWPVVFLSDSKIYNAYGVLFSWLNCVCLSLVPRH